MSVILYPCILCVALLMDLFVVCVACLPVQNLHNIYKSHIITTSIQNWRSTRWRSFTNTIVNPCSTVLESSFLVSSWQGCPINVHVSTRWGEQCS